MMDKVIYSNILLHCDYNTFSNLSKTCKMIRNTSKIIWKKWLNYHLKTHHVANLKYEYYLDKNGKRIYHGKYKVVPFDRTKWRINNLEKIINPFGARNYELNYVHGKIEGDSYSYTNDNKIKEIHKYENNLLHKIIRYNGISKVNSVVFYDKNSYCCSINNDHIHFCINHREEGMKLMNWDFKFEGTLDEEYECLMSQDDKYFGLKITDDTRQVKTVKVVIHRGIKNFVQFAKLINQHFPNLKTLIVEQNYSMDSFKNFVKLLKILGHLEIIFSDYQSDCFNDIQKKISNIYTLCNLKLILHKQKNITNMNYKLKNTHIQVIRGLNEYIKF